MKFPILLPNIFNYPFTYESDLKLNVGDFVEVPVGKSKKTGVVWDNFEEKKNKDFKIKRVIKKLDVPRLNENIVKFLNFKFTRVENIILGRSKLPVTSTFK